MSNFESRNVLVSRKMPILSRFDYLNNYTIIFISMHFLITAIMNRYIVLHTYDIFKYFFLPQFLRCETYTRAKYACGTIRGLFEFIVSMISSIHLLYTTSGFAEAIAEKLYRFTYSKNLFHSYFISNLQNTLRVSIKISEKQIKKKNYYFSRLHFTTCIIVRNFI